MNAKEKFINDKVMYFESQFVGDTLTFRFETCKDAPSYGWSVEEYMYMPQIASILMSKGYTVQSSVNWGVTDWVIAL